MEELTRRVAESASLEPAVAKAAIGHVLLFLRDMVPGGHIGAFVEGVPGAREAVAAAQATSDGGVTQAIESMTSFMGHGRADLNILAGKLANLGLTQAQTARLVEEILARATTLIGEEGVSRIRAILPALSEREWPMPQAEQQSRDLRPGA